MKKKIIIISTILAAIIVLGSCSYSITASNLEGIGSTETVNIIVNQYYTNPPNTIETKLNIEEAEEIKDILINLNEAITNNDKKAIKSYEELLNSKGIFADDYQEFYSNEEYEQSLKLNKKSKLLNLLPEKNGDNLSNLFCFFNAIGNGLFVSYIGLLAWEFFYELLSNATSIAEMFVIIVVFLPLVLVAIVFTGFFPIRLFMPKGMVYMQNGRITSIGLKGVKRVTVDETEEPVELNLSLFTGLSISIPGNEDTGRKDFVFTSGFALGVSEYQS
jgi:hypothetical protein